MNILTQWMQNAGVAVLLDIQLGGGQGLAQYFDAYLMACSHYH